MFTPLAIPSCLACLYLTNTPPCTAASEHLPPAEMYYIADELGLNAILSLYRRVFIINLASVMRPRDIAGAGNL